MKLLSDKHIMGLQIALQSVLANKVRSVLTALGIIFGVAAVIAMLAIGNGAKQEILEQMKWIGVNNIIISPIEKANSHTSAIQQDSRQEAEEKLSLGLRLQDVYAIAQQLPNIAAISAEVNNTDRLIYKANSMQTNLSGVEANYFSIYRIALEKGRFFNTYQYEHGLPVCVIGHQVEASLFKGESAIGKELKCGNLWLKVIGVLKLRGYTQNGNKLQLNDFNKSVFAPMQTVLLRYHDRSAISFAQNQQAEQEEDTEGTGAEAKTENTNKNQIDKIIVQMKNTEALTTAASFLHQMMLRRHQGVEDFKVSVPELLLKQEQKTRSIFNLVLGAIAGISLLVGGIGIMNIMLASVMERIREIGVRRAIGATKSDVVFQFLSEAILISVSGGLLGILLGMLISALISYFTDIQTLISPFSVLLSFGVSVAVGVLFGYMPAQKAAQKDPVSSLRYE